MEECLREGYFLLGKARYIMGTKSVSMLQVPSQDCDFESHLKALISKTPLEEIPALSSHEFTILHNTENLNDAAFSEESTGLRKRGTHIHEMESNEKKDKEGEEDDDDDKTKKIDPINWFSALPPQSLRKAQHHFRQAMYQSAFCATIQSKLNALSLNDSNI